MLSQFLTSQLFSFLLVFCRLGSAIMLMPGFGELYVAPRVRLLLAVLFSIILSAALTLPSTPTTVPELATLLIAEIMTGLFIGAICRMLIAAVHVAATIIAFQSSLASALTQDITGFQSQDTSLGNFLSLSAVVLLFASDLHHVMLQGLADSYNIFTPGQFPLVEDFANHATHTLSNIFRMAMQIAGPNLAIGMMLYLGAGILARLMPNIQIFFIMMAPQLMLSFFIMMVTFSAMLLWYMDFLKESLNAFLASP